MNPFNPTNPRPEICGGCNQDATHCECAPCPECKLIDGHERTCSRFILLTHQHASDSRDSSLMHSLMLSRDYHAIRAHGVLNGHEAKAFLGMSGSEVYVASGRAMKDAPHFP